MAKIKEIVPYDDFKFWKDIYVPLNVAPKMILYSKGENIGVIFETDSPFYKMFGEIGGVSQFKDWILSGKIAILETEKIITLGKMKKKDVVDVSYDELSFSFKYLNEDGEEETIHIMDHSSSHVVKNIIEKEKDINSKLKYSNNIPTSIFDEDIIELYLDSSNNTTTSKSEIKLLEIPSKKVLSAHKKSIEYTVKFNDFENNIRYVSIKSDILVDEKKDKHLYLEQMFATI